jgi:hypothetical protein
LPATSKVVPESVGRERNRAASAASSGQAALKLMIFSLAVKWRPIATISSGEEDWKVGVT